MRTNEIIHGNNLDVLPTLGTESVELVVTSPPYADLRDYRGYEWDFHKMLPMLWGVLVKGGVVCWVVGDKIENGSRLLQPERQALGFADAGWTIHDVVVWDKIESPMQRMGCHQHHYETIVIASRGKPRVVKPDMVLTTTAGSVRGPTGGTRNRDGVTFKERSHSKPTPEFKRSGNIWRLSTGNGKTSKWDGWKEHPATFPDALAARCIRTWSDEGDTVLDPFAGSGTTLAMAHKLGRKAIGIEISDQYVALAERRLADAKHDLLAVPR